VAGKIRIATSAEATAGTNDLTAMTPAKVKSVVDAAVVGGVTYKGTFDAGSPLDLSNAVKGDLYIISGAGTYAGRSWDVGDHLLVNADMGGTVTDSKIDKIDSTDSVTSVAGRTGAVVLSAGDISGLATVATSGAYSDLSGTPTLATVATTGAYSDLSGLPTLGTAAALDVGTSALNVVQLDASGKLPAIDGSQLTNLPSGVTTLDALTDVTITTPADRQVLTYDSASSEWINSAVAYADVTGTPTLAAVATTGAYSDLSGTPTLATVATTGAYSDLGGLPTLGTAAALDVGTSALNVVQLDASGKLPAVDGSQLTNLPPTSLDGITDVTITAPADRQVLTYDSASSEWINSAVAYADVTGTPTLATVATTGAYSDLSGTPTLATVATTGAYSDLSGTPTLATVATTGAYSDLSGLPTLGTAAALDVGTSALNVVQLDASAKLPAVDGSQLINLPPTSLDGITDVTITAPADRQVLTYDSASSEWINSAVAYADVTGTPTLATVATTGAYSDLSGTPTLGTAAALDVGTSALNVVQLNGSAQLPAVDGSLLTGVVATVALNDITDVTITTPADRQVLTYDSATSEWINLGIGQPTVTSASVSGSYSITTYTGVEEIFLLTTTAATTVSLPSAATVTSGFKYHIKNLGSFALTIDPNGAQTIDGASTFVISIQYAAISIVSDGANWFVI